MSLNRSALNVLYDSPSWLIHGMTLLIALGYGIYHVRTGVLFIGILALASSVCCALTMLQIRRRDPQAIYYYLLMFCQFFALLLTCYYFGIRGLVLVAPFVAGVFFLFPFKFALLLSCVFVSLALIASFPAIETKLFVRLAVAQIITLFFTIAFSHVVNQQQQMLEREAYYDYLTEVLNRRGFINWLSTELAELKKQKTDLALFYLDLDKFKEINDTYGHSIGDELLVAFANRILHALRVEDLIRHNHQVCNFARLSGDEFVLAITHAGSQKAAEKVARRILTVVGQPFRLSNVNIHITISIGACFATQCDFDVSRMFQCADSALYHSKQAGRNQIQFYEKRISQDQRRSLDKNQC